MLVFAMSDFISQGLETCDQLHHSISPASEFSLLKLEHKIASKQKFNISGYLNKSRVISVYFIVLFIIKEN